MDKKNLLIAVLIGASFTAFSQDKIPVDLKENQFYITILEPGISFEKKLAANQSLLFNAGLTTLSEADTDDFSISLNPVITGDFRNYYSRKRVKKELNSNSGNYVALRAGYYFDAIAEDLEAGTIDATQSFFMGPVWGIQRNYKSGIHLGFSIGGGISTGKYQDIGFTGLGQFHLGFAIGK
ncbi:MAG: hypothetical protein RJQ09_19760 [Cyclobacteriaceae bacterium]